jgi:hypothetical protein
MPKNLVSVDAVVKSQDEEWEYSKALNRFCQGHFNFLQPLGLPAGPVKPPLDPNKTLQAVKAARQSILVSKERYGGMLKNLNDLEERILEAFQISALLDADLHVSTAAVDGMETTFQAVQDGKRLTILEDLRQFEELILTRITGTLQLLCLAKVASRVENSEALRQEAEHYLTSANELEPQLQALRDLYISYQQLAVLVDQLDSNDDNEKLVRRIRQRMQDLRRELGNLRNRLRHTPYPFEHSQVNMTLGEFVVGAIPANDDLGAILDAAHGAFDRLPRVYARLVGRLAHVAEMVEQAVGLAPLPDPPQSHS